MSYDYADYKRTVRCVGSKSGLSVSHMDGRPRMRVGK